MSSGFWSITTIPDRDLLGVIRDWQKDALKAATMLLTCIALGPDWSVHGRLFHWQLIAHIDSIKRHHVEAARRGLTLPAWSVRDRQLIVDALQKADKMEQALEKCHAATQFTPVDRRFARQLGIQL